MKREIKFRCWNKKENKWAFGYELLGGFSMFGELHVLGQLELENLNDLEVMQFTGLKDKNGKEIYEGDILREYSNRTKITKVTWNDDLAMYDGFDSFKINKYEIIGNIYENPDLLK